MGDRAARVLDPAYALFDVCLHKNQPPCLNVNSLLPEGELSITLICSNENYVALYFILYTSRENYAILLKKYFYNQSILDGSSDGGKIGVVRRVECACKHPSEPIFTPFGHPRQPDRCFRSERQTVRVFRNICTGVKEER